MLQEKKIEIFSVFETKTMLEKFEEASTLLGEN